MYREEDRKGNKGKGEGRLRGGGKTEEKNKGEEGKIKERAKILYKYNDQSIKHCFR